LTAEYFTLAECQTRRLFAGLGEGTYDILYSDATHHESDAWYSLAQIDISPLGTGVDPSETEPFYKIKPNVDARLSAIEKANRSILDSFSLALTRAGLLSPSPSQEIIDDIVRLSKEDGIILIPDTNALHSGVVHWLLKAFKKPSVWLFPLVASLTQIQSRDATLKSFIDKTFRPNNTSQALRSRSMVNGSLGLLERNKGRSQVIELDPSLLRYLKTSTKAGSDPDQGDVLEDRLIIEGIHSILRSMRTRTTHRVVTSDVNLARILEVEGIPTLFIPSVMVDGAQIDCLRYDPFIRSFSGASLGSLLWEVAHGFGAIKLVKDGNDLSQLECYYPGKSPADWRAERLKYTLGTAQAPVVEAVRALTLKPDSAKSDEPVPIQPKPAAGIPAPTPKPKPQQATAAKKENLARPPALSILPRASLPQMLQLLGVVRRLGHADVNEIVRNVEAVVQPTPDTARRAFEILRRAGLVEFDGRQYRSTRDAELVDTALRNEDLDTVSRIFERFDPYHFVSHRLKEMGELTREEVRNGVSEVFGKVGSAEVDRLPRYHTLLGQAYSEGDVIFDGSQRPADRDAIDAFAEAFMQTSSDGLSRVVDLLRVFCHLTRMTPWAAKTKIEALIASRDLTRYTFQPAAGGRPIQGDEVVAGSLDNVVTQRVAIDRLQLGEQPVFTVGGPSR
jgi:hypothetical protein